MSLGSKSFTISAIETGDAKSVDALSDRSFSIPTTENQLLSANSIIASSPTQRVKNGTSSTF